MNISYFVLHQGRAAGPEKFARRDRDVHVPLLLDWPGNRSVQVHQPLPWHDPQGVHPSGLALMAQMTFDHAPVLEEALRSGARARARADFYAFPPFEGSVRHQAMRTDSFT